MSSSPISLSSFELFWVSISCLHHGANFVCEVGSNKRWIKKRINIDLILADRVSHAFEVLIILGSAVEVSGDSFLFPVDSINSDVFSILPVRLLNFRSSV